MTEREFVPKHLCREGVSSSRTLPRVAIPYGKPFHPSSPEYGLDGRSRRYKCFNQGIPVVHRSFWDNLPIRLQRWVPDTPLQIRLSSHPVGALRTYGRPDACCRHRLIRITGVLFGSDPGRSWHLRFPAIHDICVIYYFVRNIYIHSCVFSGCMRVICTTPGGISPPVAHVKPETDQYSASRSHNPFSDESLRGYA